ncbi:MAG: MmgE/PrpD family protein [Candidatus Rokuibacteriota bacterium]
MTLARRLAEFTAELAFEAIPPEVVASATLRCLDVIGIALASSRREMAPALMGALAGWGARGDCTVIGARETTPPPLAILVNGALAHGLDFDDTHAASITHASAVVWPTVLALAEAGGLDGRSAITAAVAGYEAITRIGMAAPGRFHARGFHATAVCGAFAAALAAGKCDKLDADRLTAALGIAGSFASGVLEHLEDGSWVKRVHPGWAGQSGAVAAALARGGFSGPATILEGRFGLYGTFLDTAPDPRPFETLGREWETTRIAFKAYPCCHYNHAYLDCALELRRVHGIDPVAIEAIECVVPEGEVPIVCEPRAAKLTPRTPYDAQFSLPFSIAAAFLDGRVGLATYAPPRLADPKTLALAARVTHVIDPHSRFPATFPGRVRVRLTGGRVLETEVAEPRGGPGRPLASEVIVAKFRENAAEALDADRLAALERAALDLAALRDVRELTTLCGA